MRAATFVLMMCASYLASASVIISPTSVINNQLGVSSGFSTASIINQSGLSSGFTSGVTDFDVYNPTGVTHTNSGTDQWLGAFPPINIPGVIDFDLGSTQTITRLAYWQPNTANGMNSFTIFIDTDAAFGSAVNLGTFSVAFNTPTGQIVDINDGTGRFVRFQHNTFHGNLTGMGEIAFEASVTVPEPTTLLLLGLGLAGLGFARKRLNQPCAK